MGYKIWTTDVVDEQYDILCLFYNLIYVIMIT